jgi:hypothetical protein
LYSFQGAPDGSGPTGRMATDDKGNLYGVTTLGGTLANGCGAQCGMVFEVTPQSMPARRGQRQLSLILVLAELAVYRRQGWS